MNYPPFVSLLVFLYILMMLPALSRIDSAMTSTRIGKIPPLRKAVTMMIIIMSTLLFFVVITHLS